MRVSKSQKPAKSQCDCHHCGRKDEAKAYKFCEVNVLTAKGLKAIWQMSVMERRKNKREEKKKGKSKATIRLAVKSTRKNAQGD